MRNIDEHNITDAVIARLGDCQDARLKEVMTSLIRHLHGFVRDVRLTEREWEQAIRFLTATGRKCPVGELLLATGRFVLARASSPRSSPSA